MCGVGCMRQVIRKSHALLHRRFDSACVACPAYRVIEKKPAFGYMVRPDINITGTGPGLEVSLYETDLGVE